MIDIFILYFFYFIQKIIRFSFQQLGGLRSKEAAVREA